MAIADDDQRFMRRALDLAEQGRGFVEPNPMVGCVIVQDSQIIGEGFHEKFGGPHAEVNAIASAGGASLEGCTVYVTLEPCCHHGKTPPCTDALLRIKPARVVVAMQDPFPKVQGGGIQGLASRGIQVCVGACGEEAARLNAPFIKVHEKGKPWVIAKWAMTLDGKLATASGSSKWISGEAARAEVHRIRGLCDGVMVGSGTVKLDDPLLTTRPPGPRTAARIVFDSQATLSPTSQLIESIGESPVMVAVAESARSERLERLDHAGCDLIVCPGSDHAERMEYFLGQLASRGMTNVLVEGGSQLLGLLWDTQQIDEVYAFIAPKIAGGSEAISPIGGRGVLNMEEATSLVRTDLRSYQETICLHGFTDFSL
ncbi:bifunctional diaminohydroxyphosphoribosylaminopyrimidine deaminase/5-amino-6-(5-phosphoribosylamino)uracil reductase RibD [Bremerella sp. P1]|uniref:bifunctional diaminohydroxyphosphoribosylaminopyrimidine deaminase/5-amino-6-(5-phosphoribosylamino)uracil reductase RibD n=1 Tax=Bremerella sp. P1 TaxID=3026424 RepID=UPI0023676FB8|nr:bifunctional diaminohydroxyphosphoribosylaminopyrimidine deaminase/5-amino-6-(5-phosphoribosylamino)uracil reductase RibD [Bremerella sp. P1]WDI44932.1 bifunctional diaminohydroxyphosphoribosylaminopyrimidine deaminase/5-amino-6-(5-phosphoribosylamino)uracil reductase RibD [Bremerella sp. P1]